VGSRLGTAMLACEPSRSTSLASGTRHDDPPQILRHYTQARSLAPFRAIDCLDLNRGEIA
jgi:hypothetical protein